MSNVVAVYDQARITEGLMGVCAAAGSIARAAEATGIPPSTLRRWKNEQYPDLYRRLEDQYGRELEEQIVALARENASLAAHATREGIERTLEDIRAGKCRDTAQATANLAKVMSTNVDKVLSLTGRPVNPEGTGAKDMMDLVKSMMSLGVLRVVDATAEEVGPGE